MPHLTDIELLTLNKFQLLAENAELRAASAKRELELFGMALRARYGGAAVKEIRADGTVVVAEPATQQE